MFYIKLLLYRLKKKEEKKTNWSIAMNKYGSLDFIRNNLPATKSHKSKLFTYFSNIKLKCST